MKRVYVIYNKIFKSSAELLFQLLGNNDTDVCLMKSTDFVKNHDFMCSYDFIIFIDDGNINIPYVFDEKYDDNAAYIGWKNHIAIIRFKKNSEIGMFESANKFYGKNQEGKIKQFFRNLAKCFNPCVQIDDKKAITDFEPYNKFIIIAFVEKFYKDFINSG